MEPQAPLTPTAQDIVGKFADLPISPKIDYKPVFFLKRGAAFLIDILILLPFYFIFALILVSTPVSPAEYNTILLFVIFILIILLIISFGYFIYFEVKDGRTIGKRALGIKVLSKYDGKVSWLSALLRAVFRIIDIILWPYLFFDPKKRRLGDLIAGTWVAQE